MPAMMEMHWTAIDRATETAGGGGVAGLQQLWLLLLLLLLLMMTMMMTMMMMMMMITLLVMMAVAKIVVTAITMMTMAASTEKGDLSTVVGRAAKRGCRSGRRRMRIEEGETGPHQHHKMMMLMMLLLLLLLLTTMLMKKKRPVPTTLELALPPSRCVCACQIETAHRRHRHPTRLQHWLGQRNDERGALAQATWRLGPLLTPRMATMARHMRGQTPQPYGCRYAMRNAAPPQPPLRC
jgi:hypothetical protein